MGKSETLISYEDVMRSFEDKITVSGGRLLGGSRVTLKAVCIYLNGVLSKIKALPRVELVRCKDCKFYNQHIRECEGFGKWFGLEDEWGDNDFCSRGERKDEVAHG